MSVKISAAERDALFEQIHARLSGIDEVWLAVEAEDWERAGQIGQDFSDYLRLIVDDLGWDESSSKTFELTTAPDVLRRVFTLMQKRAEGRREVEEEERADLSEREEQTSRLMEACRRVLGELGGG